MIRFAAFKDLTRLDQTLFALPFVLSGVFLSMQSTAFHWRGALWVIPCFLLARISGMAFNQLIDRHIDAHNPRTQNRVIPSGRINPQQASAIAWGALILFILLSLCVNSLVALLTLPAAGLLFLYSYMKRFHASCHFVLGVIHFLGPVMAFAAVGHAITGAALCLGGAAACSIIGSDIVYAIQDYEFDCQHRLFSLPSRLGIPNSLKIAASMHVVCLLFLTTTALFAHLSLIYYFMIPLVGSYLYRFHSHLWKEWNTHRHLKKVEKGFFFCNVFVSSTTLLFIVLSLL